MNSQLERSLKQLHKDLDIPGKGSLGVVLIVTKQAIRMGLPLDPSTLVTESGTQVKGLSGSSANAILRKHGVERSLGTEVGRTSRGSVVKMQKYVDALNKLHHTMQLTPRDLEEIEAYWAKQTALFFASQPFLLRIDEALSLQACISDLLDQAIKKQRETKGTKYVGALIHYLVGAKIRMFAPEVAARSFAAADESSGVAGDYVVEDLSFHVTTLPTEHLMRKCAENLDAAMRPVIVTMQASVESTYVTAQSAGVSRRIEVWDVVQFISTNVYEGKIREELPRATLLENLITNYQSVLIDAGETDASLSILLNHKSSKKKPPNG